MRFVICACTLVLIAVSPLCLFAQSNALLIDSLEGVISGGEEGTVDFGAGGGSSVSVAASTDIKQSAEQSLQITYDAVAGGYMWVARGFGLDAKNTNWLVEPDAITWTSYSGIAFYLYGSDSGTTIAFDIKDSQNEMWRTMIMDDFEGWKQIILPFEEFYARTDWQPDDAEKNDVLDFPIKSYQLEPKAVAQGVIYLDTVELVE